MMVWRDGAPLLCISNISHIYEHSTTITHAPMGVLLLIYYYYYYYSIHASQISVASSGSRCISPKEYTIGMSYTVDWEAEALQFYGLRCGIRGCVPSTTKYIKPQSFIKHSTTLYLPLTTTLHLPPT